MIRFIRTLVLVSLLGPVLGFAADANKACGLATAAELESVLGDKVSGLHGGALPNTDVQMCSANTPKARVLLRIAKRSGGSSSEAARKGIEIAKQMGAQVELKTFGPITCSTVIPPKNLEAHGFNTTCSVVKESGTHVAAIEYHGQGPSGHGVNRKAAPAGGKDGEPFLATAAV